MTGAELVASAVIAACEERAAQRFEVDGVCLVASIETVFRADISDEECERFQSLIGFGMVGVEMARAMLRPAPLGATA